MIKIKGTKGYLIALESVAMTDIVLNMFIFFFISFSLLYTFSATRMSKIEVRLPKASTAVALEGAGRIIVTINRQGDYYVDDQKVAGSGLKAALASRVKEDPGIGLLLRVDGSSKFDRVVRALDVINELDIRKVSVAAVQKEK